MKISIIVHCLARSNKPPEAERLKGRNMIHKIILIIKMIIIIIIIKNLKKTEVYKDDKPCCEPCCSPAISLHTCPLII